MTAYCKNCNQPFDDSKSRGYKRIFCGDKCRKSYHRHVESEHKKTAAIHLMRKSYLAYENAERNTLFRLLTSLGYRYRKGKWSRLDSNTV